MFSKKTKTLQRLPPEELKPEKKIPGGLHEQYVYSRIKAIIRSACKQRLEMTRHSLDGGKSEGGWGQELKS